MLPDRSEHRLLPAPGGPQPHVLARSLVGTLSLGALLLAVASGGKARAEEEFPSSLDPLPSQEHEGIPATVGREAVGRPGRLAAASGVLNGALNGVLARGDSPTPADAPPPPDPGSPPPAPVGAPLPPGSSPLPSGAPSASPTPGTATGAEAPAGGGTRPAAPGKGAGKAKTPEPPLELELKADQQSYDGQLQRYVSSGNVSAVLAGGRLMADRLEFDPESQTVYAFGSVRFQRGQQFVQASRLRFGLIEGIGEMDDVYGVLDLDGSQQDLNLAEMPSTPLPPPQPMSCPPALPATPDWHPYPWAVTAWAGQMIDTNFGDTFLFKGRFRPEYLGGLGLQRRILDAGPISFEVDANLLGHQASAQQGGEFNQSVPFGQTPSQTYADGTLGIGLRVWLQPWLNLYVVEGMSLYSESSNYERTFRKKYATFLNYLAFEVEALVTPQWSLVGRIHHRSGAFGTYSGVREGSNAYLVGLRYRFGQSPPRRAPLAVPPAQGCPGAPPESAPTDLASQLEIVTMGAGSDPSASTARPEGPPAPGTPAPGGKVAPGGNAWSRARQQERLRREAIAAMDQRVTDVQFEQNLTAERRVGFPTQLNTLDTANEYGTFRPAQLRDLTTKSNRRLVRGTISRWRFQARRVRFTPTTLTADRVGFTNDPFTPAQAWVDSENVVATLQPNGDTVIKAQRNQLRLEDRLPIPVIRQTRIRKQEEVENRWVLGTDKRDRDGFYVGYDVPIRIGQKGQLTLQPQFLVQRAIDGTTNSYPLPGKPAGAPTRQQPAETSDYFGLEAKLDVPLLGFDATAQLELSTFNPENLPEGIRSWGDLSRTVKLPLLGQSTWRLYGAYRYRVWNGSLGEQNVYSAYGTSLDATGTMKPIGRLTGNYFWRMGVGNYQASPAGSDNLLQLWRANAIGSLNLSYPLWIGNPAPLTAQQAYANSAVPIVPGLTLNTNLLGTATYYGDGANQNTITLSGGPTLTLGHFVKPFLDFTQLTVTGGGTLRQGRSPLGFDRAVDLSTIGIGLTQQIAGPLVFSGGIAFNIDAGSKYYGDVTSSYIELRWQRRAYEFGVFYSPYQGLGGVRVRINDFNFKGPGRPFIPYNPNPALEVLNRLF